MAKTTKAGIGHNSLPDHADLRVAAAAEAIFKEREKKLREDKKRMRSRLVEGKGITQDDVKFLEDMKDKTPSEIVDRFRRDWNTVGAFYPDQHEQMDLFTKKSDKPTRAAYFTMGLVAGIHGQELKIPPAVVGDDAQQMQEGFNEGCARRKAAWEDINSDGVVDGTGKKPSGQSTAAKVMEKSAQDFAQDNGDDPLMVNGERYKTVRQANAARARLAAAGGGALPAGAGDPEPRPIWDGWPVDNLTWSDDQKAEFSAWFDVQEVEFDIEDFQHRGAAAEYVRLKDAGKPAQQTFLTDPAPVVGDDFKGPQPESPPSTATESSEQPSGPTPTTTTDASTPTSPTAATTVPEVPKRHVARPDFNGDASGVRWDDDWEKWSGPQCMEFKRWFESLPAGQVPAITHPGAVDYYNLLREEVMNRELAGPDDSDDFEAKPEELAAQQARPSRQQAETPDPAAIEAAAKKLEESGFTAGAKTSRGRRKVH